MFPFHIVSLCTPSCHANRVPKGNEDLTRGFLFITHQDYIAANANVDATTWDKVSFTLFPQGGDRRPYSISLLLPWKPHFPLRLSFLPPMEHHLCCDEYFFFFRKVHWAYKLAMWSYF